MENGGVGRRMEDGGFFQFVRIFLVSKALKTEG